METVERTIAIALRGLIMMLPGATRFESCAFWSFAGRTARIWLVTTS